MPGVNVAADVAAFRASVDRVQRTDLNRAIAIALNRTCDRVQTAAIRLIREKVRIQLREVRRGFSVRRAYAGKLEADGSCERPAAQCDRLRRASNEEGHHGRHQGIEKADPRCVHRDDPEQQLHRRFPSHDEITLSDQGSHHGLCARALPEGNREPSHRRRRRRCLPQPSSQAPCARSF
jgi:hypothetical protein